MTKSLQQYSDDTLDEIGLPQFKQPLKNLIQVCEEHGWEIKRDGDVISFPSNLMVAGMPGGPSYSIYDPATGRFAHDVTGPFGSNPVAPASVAEPVASVDGAHTWISGVRAVNDANNDPIELTLTPRATLERLAEVAAQMVTEQLRQLFAQVAADSELDRSLASMKTMGQA